MKAARFLRLTAILLLAGLCSILILPKTYAQETPKNMRAKLGIRGAESKDDIILLSRKRKKKSRKKAEKKPPQETEIKRENIRQEVRTLNDGTTVVEYYDETTGEIIDMEALIKQEEEAKKKTSEEAKKKEDKKKKSDNPVKERLNNVREIYQKENPPRRKSRNW